MSLRLDRLHEVEGARLTLAQIAERLDITPAAANARLARARDRDDRITWCNLGEGKPLSRQQRMLHFIVALGRPATLDDVIGAVLPHEPDKTRRQLTAPVAAQLLQLVQFGKLERVGSWGGYTYTPTAKAMRDGRADRPSRAKPNRVARSAPAPKPPRLPKTTHAGRDVVVGKRPAAGTQTPAGQFRLDPDKPPPVVMVPNANLKRPREGALDSAQIAADVEAFLARGGRIQQFRPGESSQTVRAQQEAFLAARGGAARNARTATSRTHADNDDTQDAADEADVA